MRHRKKSTELNELLAEKGKGTLFFQTSCLKVKNDVAPQKI